MWILCSAPTSACDVIALTLGGERLRVAVAGRLWRLRLLEAVNCSGGLFVCPVSGYEPEKQVQLSMQKTNLTPTGTHSTDEVGAGTASDLRPVPPLVVSPFLSVLKYLCSERTVIDLEDGDQREPQSPLVDPHSYQGVECLRLTCLPLHPHSNTQLAAIKAFQVVVQRMRAPCLHGVAVVCKRSEASSK